MLYSDPQNRRAYWNVFREPRLYSFKKIQWICVSLASHSDLLLDCVYAICLEDISMILLSRCLSICVRFAQHAVTYCPF